METGSLCVFRKFCVATAAWYRKYPDVRSKRMEAFGCVGHYCCAPASRAPSLPDSFPSHWLSSSRMEGGPKFLPMSDDMRRMLLSLPNSFCLVLPIQTFFTISVLGAKHETLIPAEI